MVAFPEDYKSLVPKLLVETMAAVGASFVSRINLATGDVIPETKSLAKGLHLTLFFVSIRCVVLHDMIRDLFCLIIPFVCCV